MNKYSWKPDDSVDTATVWGRHAQEETTAMGQYVDRWQEAVQSQHPELLRHLVWDRERLNKLEEAINQVIGEEGLDVAAMMLYRRSLLNRLTGLGPLDALLTDDRVTDIMVNGPDQIFCERDGHLDGVKQNFESPEEVALLAQRLASRAGRVLNTESPVCDAQLVDGSRIHCVLPPVAEQPTITIRRARHAPLSLDDYLVNGSFSMELWEDLATFISERRNIVVAGGAGSGKTSLLRLLTSLIGEDERLITIEDVRELNLHHANTVSLEAHRNYSIHDLVINALRMRPDRIIVGEVRGEEAMELIEAMSTGHPGSALWTTLVSFLRNPHRRRICGVGKTPIMSFSWGCPDWRSITRCLTPLSFSERNAFCDRSGSRIQHGKPVDGGATLAEGFLRSNVLGSATLSQGLKGKKSDYLPVCWPNRALYPSN